MWWALYLSVGILCLSTKDSILRTKIGASLTCIAFTIYHQDIFYYPTHYYGMFLGVFLYGIPLWHLKLLEARREIPALVGSLGLVLNDLGYILAYTHFTEEAYPVDTITVVCLTLILISLKGAKHRDFRHIADAVRLCFSGCTSDTLHTSGVPMYCFYTAEKESKPKEAQK